MSICAIKGCRSGNKKNRNESTEKRRMFGAPQNLEKRRLWEEKCPLKKKPLNPRAKICDIHFEKQYIISCYKYIINGNVVEIPRTKYTLTPEAIPTIFPLPDSIHEMKRNLNEKLNSNETLFIAQNPKIEVLADNEENHVENSIDVNVSEIQDIKPKIIHTYGKKICTIEKIFSLKTFQPTVASFPHTRTIGTNTTYIKPDVCDAFTNCGILNYCEPRGKTVEFFKEKTNKLQREVQKLRRRVKRNHEMSLQIKTLKKKIEYLESNETDLECLPDRPKTILKHALMCGNKTGIKTGNRFSLDWLFDCLFLKMKTGNNSYIFLKKGNYLPLPELSSVNKFIKTLRKILPESECHQSLLRKKLTGLPLLQRRKIMEDLVKVGIDVSSVYCTSQKFTETTEPELMELSTEAMPTSINTLESTPIDNMQLESTPIDTMQSESTPIDNMQSESTSIDNMQSESTPIDNMQSESAPIDNMQSESAPIDNMQSDPTQLPLVTVYIKPTKQCSDTVQLESTPIDNLR